MNRHRAGLRIAIVALVSALSAVPAMGARLTQAAAGFEQALLVTAPADDDRLFVVEQGGTIRIVQPDGTVAARPFLDISGLVSGGSEQGLLGLAFHPSYATNGRFFVNYTNRAGATVVAEFRVSADRNLANATSRRRLLRIAQPFENHNGGMVAFGPDGLLYIGMGDGGSGGDPGNRAQNLRTMLGKMLRIDVDGRSTGRPYKIPGSNPFRSRRGVPPEIFALGLRNPWRFSFDRTRGDLWIADVGQNRTEEVDFATLKRARGANFGWRRWEGRRKFSNIPLSAGRLIQPVATYDHGEACSITGGYVYRGPSIPDLDGRYLFSDFCSSQIWSIRAGPTPGDLRDISGSLGSRLPTPGGNGDGGVRGFGEGADGRLYVATGSTIWRFVP
jgi:glucose/arabinose dehydrogenase